jgi:hypothetical protein
VARKKTPVGRLCSSFLSFIVSTVNISRYLLGLSDIFRDFDAELRSMKDTILQIRKCRSQLLISPTHIANRPMKLNETFKMLDTLKMCLIFIMRAAKTTASQV